LRRRYPSTRPSYDWLGWSSIPIRSIVHITMTCAGDCFGLAAPPSCQVEGSGESPMSSGITSLPHFTYSPLQPWQTRIPRLHPRETRAGEEDNNSQLRIDLLAANLHALDGVTVEGDGNLMSYTALPYSGGRPELLDVLLCNGQTRPISRSNAAALKALRHPTQPIHLWIDAVCISQEDVQEESRQVAKCSSYTRKLSQSQPGGVKPTMQICLHWLAPAIRPR
jgi:hypothetical protein